MWKKEFFMGVYNINHERTISAAEQNIYLKGARHPDRIMKEHDFVYILDGSWEIYQNNVAYQLFAGDVIILHAGQHHKGVLPCEPRTRTMYIHINNDADDIFNDSSFSGNKDSVLELGTVIHCRKNDSVKALFKNIILIFQSENPFKSKKLSRLFQLLLMELADCKDDICQNQLLEKAFIIMQNHPDKIYKTEELASQLYVSARTFRNKFYAVYHKTFTQYQMENKLEKSCLFLKDYPEMPLREIAVNLGFCNEFHFSKTFKKYYRISPSQYRKENKR